MEQMINQIATQYEHEMDCWGGAGEALGSPLLPCHSMAQLSHHFPLF